MKTETSIKEKLADFAHKSWSGWMAYLFSKSILNKDGSVTIPKDLVTRWKRQLDTDYNNLSEQEKDSDRKEAEGMIAILALALDKKIKSKI